MTPKSEFPQILQQNQDRIYRLCCYYIQDRDERQDLFQEILIHIWENLEQFKGQSHISTWIHRIAINTCLSYLRQKQRRNRLFISQNDHQLGFDQIDQDPEETERIEEQEQQIRQLHQIINGLPLMDRTLISLYLEDMNTREMSEILGISESNVRVKIHRIKQQFKNKMEENHHESD